MSVLTRWRSRLSIRKQLEAKAKKDLAAAAARERKRLEQIAFARRVLERQQARNTKVLPETMYDSTTIDQIPSNATAVAGYVGGHWPTFNGLVTRFPRARHLSIAIAASEDAECLDVEPGDATIQEAPAWTKRQIARGIKRPVLYTSASQLQSLVATLSANGVDRSKVRLWSAHYTRQAHLCGPQCGFGIQVNADATQYDDRALGRNLDVSRCSPEFWR